MNKKILVFSNGEKIGDGIIKLQLLNEIKIRLPNYKLYWITDKGKTVYSGILKNIASKYIDVYYEQANLNSLFWQNISDKFNLHHEYFDYILDTQKSVFRTLALKRIKHGIFISGSANGFFSSIKIRTIKNNRYYLDNIFDLLDLICKKKVEDNFQLPINTNLEKLISQILKKDHKYIGIAPGAGEQNKIWSIKNFIEISNYIQTLNIKLVFFIGPEEIYLKEKLYNLFPASIFIEDLIKGYSNIEIIMASTKFLELAISNDSGVSHMLSTGYCPLIKLFGPKNAKKFTPDKKNLYYISSDEFKSLDINTITTKRVIKEINKLLEINN
tara:strand:- start:117 stop:1100 length:984 start_codon:yes stop_codon:yes gene_type:complete